MLDHLFNESKYKDIKRFISTHPDEDHFHGIEYFDENISVWQGDIFKENARKIFADTIVCDPNRDVQLGKNGIFSVRNCIDSPNPEMTGGSGL